MPPTPQNTILALALEALEREAGLRAQIEERKPAGPDRPHNTAVRLDGARFLVDVKKWAQHANLGALIHRIKQLPERGILVADFVNPRMAEKLRAENVQFIDTAGNAFIDAPPLYLYIRGNRPARFEATKPARGQGAHATGRAFAPTGLKVVFAFLRDPELVDAPFRTIADTAGTAVGTVGWVLNDLKAERFVADLGKRRGRRLVDYRRLLAKWTEAYPQKLRPKLLLGIFEAPQADWWVHADLEAFAACFGGETAAAKLTRYLKPEITTIYLPANRFGDFMAANRLRKPVGRAETDATNRVDLLQEFWKTRSAETEFVDPVLIYADLIATADPRNREAAQIVLDEHIAQRIEEY